MSVYVFMLLTASAFSFLYTFSKDASARIVFIVICFLCLFIPASLRYGIGADYFSYARIFNNIQNGRGTSKELGIVLISKVLQFFSLPSQSLFITYSFLSILFVFLGIKREFFYVSVPVYLLIFYLDAYCLLRQGLACSIMVYAFRHYFNRKYKKFVFWSAIAFLNHKVVVIPALLIIIFSFLPELKGERWTFVYFALFAVFFVFRKQIVNFIMEDIVGLTPYARYALNKFASKEEEMGTGLGFLLKNFCMGICLLLICQSDLPRQKKTVAAGSCIYMGFTACLSTVLYIMVRLVNSVSFIWIFLVELAIQSRSRYRKILMHFILFSLFLLWVWSVPSAYIGKESGKQIFPYTSIFNYQDNAYLVSKSKSVLGY